MMLGEFYNTWISPQHWLDRAGVRAPMQIVIGLVLLTACVLMFANALRLVPNDDEASLRVRTLVAEMASSRVASAVTTGDYAGVYGFLEELVKRHDYVLSAGLRRQNGTIVVQTAGHEKNWAGAPPNVSTPTHIQVLLYDNKNPWGRLEIVFEPLQKPATWAAWWSLPRVRLMIFIIAGCYIFFWLFLSRMLKMLDPSAAVPERMQLMMDTLVEGMVILDDNGQIVMVNQSFERTAFSPVDRLIGRTLSSLPWVAHDTQRAPEVYPWQAVQQSDLPQRGVPLRLQIGARHDRRLNVNASPILDPGGTRQGVLVTFDDQTIVESDNLQLAKFIAKFSEASDGIHEFREQLKSLGDFEHLAKLEELAIVARDIAGISKSAAEDAPVAPVGTSTEPKETEQMATPDNSQISD
jgi:PAS domain S-box-containing protein